MVMHLMHQGRIPSTPRDVGSKGYDDERLAIVFLPQKARRDRLKSCAGATDGMFCWRMAGDLKGHTMEERIV